jgi:hypothetical protein
MRPSWAAYRWSSKPLAIQVIMFDFRQKAEQAKTTFKIRLKYSKAGEILEKSSQK